MNSFLWYILIPGNGELIELVVAGLRIAIGIIMMCHGIEKFYGGIETWRWLGRAMENFGIYRLPAFWGFLAACAEFFGGFFLMLGLGTRIATLFLLAVMAVAYTMHRKNGDPFQVYSHTLTLIVIFLSFLVMGGGQWSGDHAIIKQCTHKVHK